MSKTFMEKDLDAELEGVEDSDEEMEKDAENETKEEDEEDEDDDEEDMDEDDDGYDKETLEKISSLERDLVENQYNYSTHTQLIALLRKGSDFQRLRESRERFSQLYPLSPDLWIDWIQDELKIASSEEDKQMVITLFERGIKDYVSVDLWLEYCQYGLAGIGTPEGIKAARAVYERSLTACGLHAEKGSLLWESYREFESALLSLQGTPSTADQTKAHSQQRSRVLNLLKRQLRVPLLDMENTLQEYKEFVGEEMDPNVQREYTKAKEKLTAIEDFEIKVSDKEGSLDAYKEYLKYELKEKDPARIQLLYERTLTDHCLVSEIWEQYLHYLDTNLRIDTVSLPVYERAVRNCPWGHTLWCEYIRALERYEKPHSEVVRVFEEALAVGFTEPSAFLEVWLSFVDYTRRRVELTKEPEPGPELRAIFDRACEHLNRMGGDPECVMLKYYANIEADLLSNLENARKIWADILQVHPFKGAVWVEAVQFEKIFGDKKHLRKRLERALEKTHDIPETIAKCWLQFEREEGSLEAFDHCQKIIKLKMDKIALVREKEGRGRGEEEYAQEAKVEKKKEKDKQHRREKRQQVQTDKRHHAQAVKMADYTEKEEREKSANGDFKVPTSPALHARKTQSSPTRGVDPPPGFVGKVVEPPPGFTPQSGKVVAPPPGYVAASGKVVAPPPGYVAPEGSSEPPAKKRRLGENLSEEELKKLKTVFLSNLDFEVDEDKISSILGSSGQIREVRLVKHPNGKSKGFAFVEFSSPEEAQAVLKRDNELVSGRPLYISECDPEKRKGPVFKYTTGLEKNKLFIKGLDLSVTKEDLTELFSQFGRLTDVRLVTYRNGHSKGLAFVDFKEEVDAAKALVKTDGMKVKEKEIEVALSNPPKRKEEPASQPADMRSLGGTQQKDFGPRGKGRSQIAFMPRSVSVSVPAKPDKKLLAMKFVRPVGHKENGAGGSGDATGEDNQQPTIASETKSNDDFRKMLLGSK